MGKFYLANAFSLSMLNPSRPGLRYTLSITTISTLEARMIVQDSPEPIISIIGHDDMAAILSLQLGIPVEKNRVSVRLQEGDHVLVAQYIGERLPEGSIMLPEGARIAYMVVTV